MPELILSYVRGAAEDDESIESLILESLISDSMRLVIGELCRKLCHQVIEAVDRRRDHKGINDGYFFHAR